LAATASTASPAFNRILAHRSVEKQLPASFTPRGCADVGGSEVCIFARSGGCAGDAAASFAINDVLARTGL
jgi:hypothetical protein